MTDGWFTRFPSSKRRGTRKTLRRTTRRSSCPQFRLNRPPPRRRLGLPRRPRTRRWRQRATPDCRPSRPTESMVTRTTILSKFAIQLRSPALPIFEISSSLGTPRPEARASPVTARSGVAANTKRAGRGTGGSTSTSRLSAPLRKTSSVGSLRPTPPATDTQWLGAWGSCTSSGTARSGPPIDRTTDGAHTTGRSHTPITSTSASAGLERAGKRVIGPESRSAPGSRRLQRVVIGLAAETSFPG